MARYRTDGSAVEIVLHKRPVLDARYKEIIQQIVYYGRKQHEIAEFLNYAPGTVSGIVNTEEFQEALGEEIRRKNVADRESRIHKLADESVEILSQIVRPALPEILR